MTAEPHHHRTDQTDPFEQIAVALVAEIDEVLAAQRNDDAVEHLEIHIEGFGAPPAVLEEIARAGLHVTAVDARFGAGPEGRNQGTGTVVRVMEVGR